MKLEHYVMQFLNVWRTPVLGHDQVHVGILILLWVEAI